MIYNGNCASGAYFLTFMSQTATAGFCYNKTVNGTFITCGIQHIDDTIILCGFHYQTHTIFNDMAFFINTAAEQGFGARNNLLCDFSDRINGIIQIS